MSVDNSTNALDNSTNPVDNSTNAVDNSRKNDVKSETSFVQIDELAVMEIASYLSGSDFINFSHLNSKCFNLIKSKSDLWSKEIERNQFSVSPEIEKIAEESEVTGCSAKQIYWTCRKIKDNFLTGNYNRIDFIPELIPCYHEGFSSGSQIIGNCVYWFDLRDEGDEDASGSKLLPETTFTLNEWSLGSQSLRSFEWTMKTALTFSSLRRSGFSIRLQGVTDNVALVRIKIFERTFGFVKLFNAIDIETEGESPVIWKYLDRFDHSEMIVEGSKILRVTDDFVQTFDIRTGAMDPNPLEINERSIDIFKNDELIRKSNEKFLVLLGTPGMLVVDLQQKTYREILDGHYQRLDDTIIRGDLIVRAMTGMGRGYLNSFVKVWNLSDGELVGDHVIPGFKLKIFDNFSHNFNFIVVSVSLGTYLVNRFVETDDGKIEPVSSLAFNTSSADTFRMRDLLPAAIIHNMAIFVMSNMAGGWQITLIPLDATEEEAEGNYKSYPIPSPYHREFFSRYFRKSRDGNDDGHRVPR